MAARLVAVDRRGIPPRAAWRRDAISIKAGGDLARRATGDELGKDAPHDRGLALVDDELARLAGNGAIAIGAAAGVTSVANDRLEAAAGVDGKIAQISLAENRVERAVKETDCARCDVDPDAEEIEALARRVIIGLIAEQAIHVLGDDDVEQLRLGRAHQCIEAGTVEDRGARDLTILKRHGNGEIFPRANLSIERDLIVDGFLVLPIGGKAGVNGGADHGGPPSGSRGHFLG